MGSSRHPIEVIEEIEEKLEELRSMIGGAPRRRSPSTSNPTAKFDAGPFKPFGPTETTRTYRWPQDKVERYASFQRYSTPGGVRLGIGTARPAVAFGRERPSIVVHEVGQSSQLSALSVFIGADDVATSGEFLSVIKGNGDGGRRMFRPTDELPASYESASVEVFSSRVTGPYTKNGLSVVADGSDIEVMLTHALYQKKLREKR